MPATPFEVRIRQIGETATVLRPAGPGPFPVVVQLHGCGGRGLNQQRWAELAQAHGYAACILDSYTFRGIRRPEAIATICTGLRLWGRERAGDLFAGLAWLRRQSWADGRFLAAGWSHGGWTVLDAMALQPQQRARSTKLEGLPEQPLAGLGGAFLMYPYLGVAALAPRQGLAHPAPVCAIIGGADLTVGTATPLAALKRLGSQGARIETVLFENATHDFDEACVEGGLRAPGSRYDPALTERAQTLFLAFLAQTLSPALVQPGHP